MKAGVALRSTWRFEASAASRGGEVGTSAAGRPVVALPQSRDQVLQCGYGVLMDHSIRGHVSPLRVGNGNCKLELFLELLCRLVAHGGVLSCDPGLSDIRPVNV